MTEVGDDPTDDLTDDVAVIKQYSDSASFNSSSSTLKRVNSFNSLTIPGEIYLFFLLPTYVYKIFFVVCL